MVHPAPGNDGSGERRQRGGATPRSDPPSPGDEARALARLPLALLQPSEEFADTLHSWGIRTFGDLSRLPAIGIAVMIRSIETFKIFDPVYILTRGQPGGATETISMYMYNGAFVYFRMGYIAAAALIVLVLVVSICLAMARPLKQHG